MIKVKKAKPVSAQQIKAVQWLRKTHGWIGLWGATLGLLFGFSGIWLNHRDTLKLPMAQQRSSEQLQLPDPAPADAQALALWLQSALHQASAATQVRSEPAKAVAWAEAGAAKPPLQPERWTVNFNGPRNSVQAELWVGNQAVKVRSIENGLLATLTHLHKGTGMPIAWILLVDTLAGSLILLSLSGLSLWLLTHRRRLVGLLVLGSALTLTLGLALT